MATKSFVRRFAQVPGKTEPPEYYEAGGFHPVHLGDKLGNHYRILRKLGRGTCATVWLAKDEKLDRYVALKVAAATGCRVHQEAEFIKALNRPGGSHPGKSHIQQLLDEFKHTGPNGTHHILVLEPMGRTLEDYLYFHTEAPETMKRSEFVREVSRQVILGLDYIHSRGIAHRDLQLGNILFAVRGLTKRTEASLQQDVIKNYRDIYQLQRLDGKPLDNSSPAYTVEARPLDDGVPITVSRPEFRIVISDFGAASTFANVNDGYHAFPVALRPPELTLGIPLLPRQADIWSLGCVIFQIAALRPLFSIYGFSTPDEKDDEHLQSITEVLGPLPPDMLLRWCRRKAFVDDNGKLLEKVVEEGISEPLEELVRLLKPVDMGFKEEAMFIDFLRLMLRFEPERRALTGELLRHPWLARGTSSALKGLGGCSMS